MAAFNKFIQFVADVFNGVHNFGSDQFRVMYTNVAPVATNSVKANLTEIAAGNGYPNGGSIVAITSSTQTGGAYAAAMGTDVTVTAAGGTIGPLRYAVVYNDTAAGDPLVGFFDYGSSVTLQIGESITFKSSGVNLITAS
jgi:hypothetical protein